MRDIGIALGGGGARGLAHIGVLRVLERERVPIRRIAGTSMGAIIGACYAANPDAEQLYRTVKYAVAGSLFANLNFGIFRDKGPDEKKTLFTRAQDFLKFGYLHIIEETRYSLLSLQTLRSIIDQVLPDIDIADTKIPFACVATDLTHGKEKVFTRGSLRTCVLASASIPGVFPPVVIGDTSYTDGGAVSVTPVRAARALGARFVIASDVKSRIMRCEKMDKAKEVLARSNYITGVILNDLHLREADVVISPEVKLAHWTEFDKLDFMAREGEKAAERKMMELKAKEISTRLWNRVRGIFSGKGDR